MKQANFWAKEAVTIELKGGRDTFVARGWSRSCFEEAKAHARARAEKVAHRIATGDKRSFRYQYGEQPLPEPVLQRFDGRDGAPLALITRNAYGALVLNTASMCFVDIDLPEELSTGVLVGFLAKLLGRQPVAPDPATAAIQKVQGFLQFNAALAGRLYRTRSGLRVLLAGRHFEPASAAARDIFNRLDADPLYRKLCVAQESFRARLTPKPWRCDVRMQHPSFPYLSTEDERQLKRFEKEYDRRTSRFATCELISDHSDGRALPEFQSLIEVHDRMAGVGTGKPLA